jgi:DNA-binding NarL/FixJ family response regulator
MTDTQISILLIDPHTLLRTGIRLILESQPGFTVIGEASSSCEGLDLVAALKPDVILLKLNQDENPDLELITRFLKASHRSRIILLARREEANICVKEIEQGVLGVVFTTVQPEVLVKAIQKVHAGEVWIEHSMMTNLLLNISRAKLGLINDPETEHIMQLSNREKQVIQLIGRGMKNKQIAEMLCISETTVRHHLTSVYGKLGVTDRLELLVYANRYHLA